MVTRRGSEADGVESDRADTAWCPRVQAIEFCNGILCVVEIIIGLPGVLSGIIALVIPDPIAGRRADPPPPPELIVVELGIFSLIAYIILVVISQCSIGAPQSFLSGSPLAHHLNVETATTKLWKGFPDTRSHLKNQQQLQE
jgi:hypothetical protein